MSERECSIHAIQWALTWPGKLFQKGSSICRHDLEKMNSRISSTMEPKIEVDKGTCVKPERRRVTMASRWLCETLWVQTGTYYWDLPWQRRCCKNSESQNGKWRAEPASCEVSVSILQWYFRDRKQVRPCWRHFKSSTKAIRKQKITEKKTLEFFKTQKWSKLKIFTSWDWSYIQPPRLLEGKTWSTWSYGTQLRLALSYSWTLQTLLHQTHICGY